MSAPGLERRRRLGMAEVLEDGMAEVLEDGCMETRSPAKSAPSILCASPQGIRRLGMAREALAEDW
jgi:hypothetical protein